jgi:hypothetical protein
MTLPDTLLTGEPLADLDALPETIPGLSPELVYRRGILEPPPSDLLTVRGRDHAPIARVEVPRMGGFWCATAVSPWGFARAALPTLFAQNSGPVRSCRCGLSL